jgi:hypothetical protein
MNQDRNESLKAVRRAKVFARQGNQVWAQMWLNRAATFWPVSAGTVTTVNRLLREARDRIGEEHFEERKRAGYSL